MNKIMELRKEWKMSQETFAEFCDVSRVSIARYETGASISRQNAEKIARACNISIDDLLCFEPPDSSTPTVTIKEPSSQFLTPVEDRLVQDYRSLSARGKQRVQEIMQEMLILYPDQ